jgi:hypothetical protein
VTLVTQPERGQGEACGSASKVQAVRFWQFATNSGRSVAKVEQLLTPVPVVHMSSSGRTVLRPNYAIYAGSS